MQLVSTKSSYSITNKGCEAWLIQKRMKQFLSGTIDQPWTDREELCRSKRLPSNRN